MTTIKKLILSGLFLIAFDAYADLQLDIADETRRTNVDMNEQLARIHAEEQLKEERHQAELQRAQMEKLQQQLDEQKRNMKP